MSWEKFNRKGYHQFTFDGGSCSPNLIGYCREVFGDNDPLQPFSERRWITQGTSVYLKNAEDVFWLKLKLKEKYNVEAH